MEAQTALVGADGGVELYPVAPVDVDFALIVGPRDAEADHALWLDKALHEGRFLVFGVALDHRFQTLQHFQNRLMEFLLIRVSGDHLIVHPFHIGVLQHVSFLRSERRPAGCRPYFCHYAIIRAWRIARKFQIFRNSAKDLIFFL